MDNSCAKLDLTRWSVLYMYATSDGFENILKSKALKISLTRDVNDPMENLAQTGNKHMRIFQAERIRSELPPYFCFSKTITNPQLWGLYAEKNKGVCLAFLFPIAHNISEQNFYDVGEDCADSDMKNTKWGDVIYDEKRVIFENDSATNSLIFTKGKDWEYEQEVRCVCHYDAASECKDGKLFYKWPLKYLAGVVLGAECKYTKGYVLQKLELSLPKEENELFSRRILKSWGVSRALENDFLYEYHAFPWIDDIDGEKYCEACNLCRAINMMQTEVLEEDYVQKIGRFKMRKPMPWSEWATLIKHYTLKDVCKVLNTSYKDSLPALEKMGVRFEVLSRINNSLPMCLSKDIMLQKSSSIKQVP